MFKPISGSAPPAVLGPLLCPGGAALRPTAPITETQGCEQGRGLLRVPPPSAARAQHPRASWRLALRSQQPHFL